MAAGRVLHWNGRDLPEELRSLPAGTYVVEAIDEVSSLTPEEDAGLRAALASYDAGRSHTGAQVRASIDHILGR